MAKLNDDLLIKWKMTMPAHVAGSVEHLLFDRIHGKPLYGARTRLYTILSNMWLDSVAGRPVRDMPSLEEIRNA